MRNPALGFSQVAKPTTANSINFKPLPSFSGFRFRVTWLSRLRSDIDELVQEVRSRCCDKIQHLYSKIQLLNRQQIDVDKLYVDVYVLEKLSSESYATIPDLLKGSDLRDGFDRLGLGAAESDRPDLK
jgi:hypothetical protein